MSSDFIKGVVLADTSSGAVQAQFGEEVPQGVSQAGLFKVVVARALSGDGRMKAYFLVGPSYAGGVFSAFALTLVAMTVGSLFIVRAQERKEAARRETIVRTAIDELVSGMPPSPLLERETPSLVKKWSEMSVLLDQAKRRERELASEAALAGAAMQIAHDINSPLSALNMIASSPSVSKLPESEILRQVSDRISQIAATFLKKNMPKRNLVRTPLNPILKQIVDEKRVELGARGDVVIRLSGTNDVAAIVDPVEFGRIASNLLNNAIQAKNKPVCEIDVAVTANGGSTCFSVADNGKGFPPEIFASLGKKGVSQRDGGHGLGLYHAHNVVTGWGGRMQIDSTPGQGAKVFVYLNQ